MIDMVENPPTVIITEDDIKICGGKLKCGYMQAFTVCIMWAMRRLSDTFMNDIAQAYEKEDLTMKNMTTTGRFPRQRGEQE